MTSEPVDVHPGPYLERAPIVLLGWPRLGACDSTLDLENLVALVHGRRDRQIYDYLAGCNCQNTLDAPIDCYRSCARQAGFSLSCADCYAALSACSGASCYAEFLTCAGYPVDFAAYPLAHPTTADCEGSGCIAGARVGEPCKRPADCMSGACRALPHTAKSSICILSRSVTCAEGSPYCYCARTTDTGGFCDQ